MTADVQAPLEAQDIVYTYDRRPAVNGVSFAVPAGSVVALLGPNGSGKTTTLSLLTGQLVPDRGVVRVLGEPLVEDAPERRRAIGFVPDHPDIYEYLTGRQYIRFVAGLWGMRSGEADAASERWLARFDLVGVRDRLVASYSHGMRQRLQVAAMLTHDPAVLVLDEPIVGLDPQSARTLRTVLRERAEGGGAVLFSTHLIDIAARLADRIVVLQAGQVRFSGTADELRTAAGMGAEGDLEEAFFSLVGTGAGRGDHVD